MRPGDRVEYRPGQTGEVVRTDYEQGRVLLYVGTQDGKRQERWFPKEELAPLDEMGYAGVVGHRGQPPARRTDMAECICENPEDNGSYTVGCPFHIQKELERGPQVSRRSVGTHTVTYYHATVLVSEPVLVDGAVWSSQHTITCDHNHRTVEAAEECADSLKWRGRI